MNVACRAAATMDLGTSLLFKPEEKISLWRRIGHDRLGIIERGCAKLMVGISKPMVKICFAIISFLF
jgi:hypothetical protein